MHRPDGRDAAGGTWAAGPDFAQRMRQVIDVYAHPKGTGEPGYGTIAARLWLREDAAWCSKRLTEMLAVGPSGDMFWMFPVTAIAYLDRGQLTPAARKALRDAWRTYAPYRGDTENHFLLYYTSLYLMAQLYPQRGSGDVVHRQVVRGKPGRGAAVD